MHLDECDDDLFLMNFPAFGLCILEDECIKIKFLRLLVVVMKMMNKLF
jgi:hypothetical protein